MALAELIEKLKSKKQAAHKSTFQQYLTLVTELAGDAEVDHDEAELILKAVSKSFDDHLPHDVKTKKERIAQRSMMDINRQAITDRIQAERELSDAQRKLQEAMDRLQPAVEVAYSKLANANHRASISTGAEEWLSDPANILDKELLAREAAVVARLREVNNELKPLLQDQARKQTFVSNLEARLAELQKAASVPWLPLPVTTPWLGRVNGDIRTIESRISDVRSELQQLDRAIQPRQQEQQRLQAELNQIHQQKLLP
jgi:hypothetical protein